MYVVRHGEKDVVGDLTERGREVARQLGNVMPIFVRVYQWGQRHNAF
jgi:broad specificity phosphatase PhoE